jgi:hypothetical protein
MKHIKRFQDWIKYDDTRIIRIGKIKKILSKIKPVDTY